MKIRPIILSGGSGTRLWPISRRDYPKQFAELWGDCSILVATMEMLWASDLFLPPLLVANEDHKFFILDALQRQSSEGATVILEPCGRNTSGAALTAALAERDEAILHLLMPSDHIIKDHEAFFAAIRHALPAAAEGRIALFGMKPEYPETGYGYIQSGEPADWPQVNTIKSFKEKPDLKTAQALIDESALWNSGIVLYDPQKVIEEMKRLAPDHIEICQAALDSSHMDLGCRILGEKAYEKLANISFDYLVMENTHKGVVVSCAMGWSDVGSWQALWQFATKDDANNVIAGSVTTLNVQNSYLRSDGPVVGVIGLKDIAVIAMKDAVLITSRSQCQDVKNLVAMLEGQAYEAATSHSRIMRPWGSYEGVANGERFQVKHVIVKPQHSLSLQMHHHRAEHWVVVAGTALVECDGIQKTIHENESVFIAKGSKHRLSNPGKINLHVVEVQSGEYLGEDDIVRFEDRYGRGQCTAQGVA